MVSHWTTGNLALTLNPPSCQLVLYLMEDTLVQVEILAQINQAEAAATTTRLIASFHSVASKRTSLKNSSSTMILIMRTKRKLKNP